MEIRAKQRILDTLKASAELAAQMQADNISSDWHDVKKGYPQITVTQISRRPGSYSDDKTEFRVPLLQVDIWSEGNPFIISDLVQAIILEAEGIEAADEREQNEETVNRVILEYNLID